MDDRLGLMVKNGVLVEKGALIKPKHLLWNSKIAASDKESIETPPLILFSNSGADQIKTKK
jgi:hypothetical protein